MERKGILNWSWLLPVLFLLATAGCTKDDRETAWYQEDPQMIGPDGGTLTGFRGEVVLTIPEGALKNPVRIEITHIPRGGGWPGTTQNEFLKPFRIEPYVAFDKPVHVTLKCKGCLSLGNEISDGTDVYVNVWGNQEAYCSQSGSCTSCFCCSNASSQCIETCVRTTGIISTRKGKYIE
jgi:hypothetical protein